MFRTARTLVFYPDPDHGLTAHNYLQNKRFSCSTETLRFMERLREWHDVPEIAAFLDAPANAQLADQLGALEAAGCLIAQGSEREEAETQHCDAWKWGVPTALYHASLVERPIIAVEEALAQQRLKLHRGEFSPTGADDARRFPDAPQVPLPDSPLKTPLQDAIDARRTNREKGGAPVTLADIAACLNNALGIQASGQNEAGAPIVFKPTPSGGARGPFDAFVFARRVEALARGTYAYDPVARGLRETEVTPPDFCEFLNGQDWPNNMDALIVLQANFARTMWKYHDANAYRVVLIEAGHIGQNIMLAATARGLSACPSAAINHPLAASVLPGNDPIMAPAVYALGLVRPLARH